MNKRERGALSISEEGIVCPHRRLVKDVACAGNAHGGRAGGPEARCCMAKNAGVMVSNDIFMANPEKDKAETKTEGASDTPKCHITYPRWVVLTLILSALCPCSAVGSTSRSKHSLQTAPMMKRTKFPRSKLWELVRGQGGRW